MLIRTNKSNAQPVETALPEWVRENNDAALSSASKNACDPQSSLLTLTEAAAQLRISPRTLRRMVKSGKLTALRIGRQLRFDRDTLYCEISNLDNRRD
jgi:excisionase family DNA binding protein